MKRMFEINPISDLPLMHRKLPDGKNKWHSDSVPRFIISL